MSREENAVTVIELPGEKLTANLGNVLLTLKTEVTKYPLIYILALESLMEAGKEYERRSPSLLVSRVSWSAFSFTNHPSQIWSSNDDYTLKGDKEREQRKVTNAFEGTAQIYLHLISI